MKVVFDTNILLDAILERSGYASVRELFDAVADEEISGYVTANTITDIYYISRKSLGDLEARQAIQEILNVFDVAEINGEICGYALTSLMADFEDTVLAYSAYNAGADYIVTRDKVFSETSYSPVEVKTPEDMLKIIQDSIAKG